MKQKSAVEWLVEQIENQQKFYIDLAKKDKTKRKEVDAILTATTLFKMKCGKAKEMEKQQMWNYIETNYVIGENSLLFHKQEFEQYYEMTYGK
jgi:hypothetical protein